MTTRRLRDALFALDPTPADGTPWRLRGALDPHGPWPRLKEGPGGRLSVKAFCRRFSNAGRELRDITSSARPSAWRHITRDEVVRQLRARIRNPGILDQDGTGLCGPVSLLFEFARRRPARYVIAAGELLFDARFTTAGGRVFHAATDLRERPVPTGGIAAADWLFCATIRDDENVTDDVDDGTWIEGITWPYELEEWIADVLELQTDWHPCVLGGEIDALLAGHRAIRAGGVAILLVDSAIVAQEPEDDEENVWSVRRHYSAEGGQDGFNTQVDGPTHCEDDDSLYPNHYVVLLGDLDNARSETQFSVKLWSYASEFTVAGSGDGFGEYLYGVITGTP